MTTRTKRVKKSPQASNIKTPAATGTRPLKSGRQNSDAIIMKIAKTFKDRSRKEIQSWRLALLSAENNENPRFNRYFDLVDDLQTDGTLKAQILLRKSSTLSTGFQVRNKKTGKLNEAATELLQQKWFYKYLNVQLDAILYGTRVIEFLEFNGNHIKFAVVPPRNTVPTQGRIYPDLSKDNVFIDYNEPEQSAWLIVCNNDNPLGIINDIIPNLIWKRNVAQSWAEFCEKFGMPMISATTNNSNTTHIDNVERQLLSLAEASVGVFPEGTTIKFDEANRTDAYNVYQKFIDQNSKEISGVIVGSDSLGQSKANRSNTEVHERALDYKIAQADRRDIAFNVSDDLLPLLKRHGYSFITDYDVLEFVESKEELDLEKYWQIASGIMQEYEVEEEWISATFNIPIVGKKKSTNPVVAKTNIMPLSSYLKPDYPKASCCPSHPKAASRNKILDGLTQGLMLLLWKEEDTIGLEGTMIVEEALELTKGLKKGYGVTTGWNTPDTLAYQLMEYNLFEFTASKTEARLAAMTDLLMDKEKNQIRSFSDFQKLAEKEVQEFNGNWLETEYNLSIAVGQNAAAYQRFLNEKDTVTSFVQYQTIGDSNVRNEHQQLNGKVFNISDAEAMKIWPPNGYGCRCEFLQFVGEPGDKLMRGKQAQIMLDGDKERWSKSQFAINRGDLKQVFTKKQFYSDIKGLPEKLNQMTFDKYGLKPWKEFKSNLNPIKLDTSITPDNVKELFKTVGKERFMRFKDYNDRKIVMSKKVFDDHTEGIYITKDERRHQLFPHLKEVMSNPDEVWLFDYKNNNQKFQNRYVKFYKDQVLIVDCEIKKESFEIKTWYPLKANEISKRNGFLIKKGKD